LPDLRRTFFFYFFFYFFSKRSEYRQYTGGEKAAKYTGAEKGAEGVKRWRPFDGQALTQPDTRTPEDSYEP